MNKIKKKDLAARILRQEQDITNLRKSLMEQEHKIQMLNSQLLKVTK